MSRWSWLIVLLVSCGGSGLRTSRVPPPPPPLEMVPQMVPIGAEWTHSAVSPDGRLVLLGERLGNIRVVDTQQQRILRVLDAHSERILDLLIRPDGKTAVSVGKDGAVCVLDLVALQITGCRRGSRKIDAAAISPDGEQVLLASRARIEIYDVDGGGRVRTIAVKGQKPIDTAWSLDGTEIAALFDIPSTGPRREDQIDLTELAPEIDEGLELSESGQAILGMLISGERAAFVWTAATGALRSTIAGDGTSIAFNREGLVLTDGPEALQAWTSDGELVHRIERDGAALGTSAGQVLRSGSERRTLVALPGKRVLLLQNDASLAVAQLETEQIIPLYDADTHFQVISANGAGSFAAIGAPGVVALIDTDAWETAQVTLFPLGAVLTGVLTADGQAILGINRGLLRFDLASGTIRTTPIKDDAVVEVAGNGRFFVTDGNQGRRLWAAAVGSVTPLRDLSPLGTPAFACGDGAQGCWLLDGDSLSDAAAGDDVRALPPRDPDEPRPDPSMAISADGRRVARDNDWSIEILNTTNQTLIGTFAPEGAVDAMTFSPDGESLYVAEHDSMDGRRYGYRIVVMDVATGKRRGRLPSPSDGVQSMTVSADGRWLLVGEDVQLSWFQTGQTAATDVVVIDLKRNRITQRLHGHRDKILSVSIAPDNAHVLSVSADGTARIWDLASGHSIAITVSGEDWVIYDDDGTFDASRNGARLVAAIEGDRAYAIDQLAVRNNRPDLLLEQVGLGSPEVIAYFRGRHERRIAALGLTEDQLDTAFGAAPTVRIAALETDGDSFEIGAELASTAAPLAAYQIWVNQVPVFPGRGKTISGGSTNVRERVPLSAGNNRVEISAWAENGVESLRAVREVAGLEAERGDLYVVAIGVSSYQDPSLTLAYAAKDATDVIEIFEAQEGSLYREVHSYPLLDEEVTVDALRDARQFVADATIHDTVVVFVAGHGTSSDDDAAEYLFVTSDYDPARAAATTAPMALIEALVTDVAARKKVLLLDTCESGERDAESVAPPPVNSELRSRVARALRVRAKTGDRVPRPFVLDRDRLILTELGLGTGTIVLGASRWDESSYESPVWENGAFTAELKAALTSDVADVDGDGTVTIDELAAHVAAAVAERTGGLQHPILSRDNRDAGVTLR